LIFVVISGFGGKFEGMFGEKFVGSDEGIIKTKTASTFQRNRQTPHDNK
jgi:hypothetical protein